MNALPAAHPPHPAYGQGFPPFRPDSQQQLQGQQPFYPGSFPQGQPPQQSFANQGISHSAVTSGPGALPVSQPAYYSASPHQQALHLNTLPVNQAPLQKAVTQAQPNNMATSAQPAPLNHPTPSQQKPAQAQMQAPLSPRSASREKARVTVLLDINSALLQEVVNLQAAGKAGVPSNQPQQSPTTDGPAASPTSATDPSGGIQNSPADAKPNPLTPSKAPSQDYIDCMRRLQANLAYLATIADRQKKPGSNPPSAPAIMTPPPNLVAVKELYVKLNELFVGAVKAAPAGNQQKAPQS